MSLSLTSNSAKGYTIHIASSLGGFEQWVDLVKNQTTTTIYRGQRKDYALLPNICRNKDSLSLLAKERDLIALFKKKAPQCLQLVPSNDWEWLALAQHHGLHTRLLDWTQDPYAALWFSLEKASEKDSRPVVWVMRPLKEDIIESTDNSRPFSGTRTKVFSSAFQIPRLKAQKGCFVLFKHIETSQKGFVALEHNKNLRERLARVNIKLGAVVDKP